MFLLNKAILFSALLFILVGLISAVPKEEKETGDQDWWKHAVFYQIYPRSFKDSDGDGIGDLQGIISKLDHLVHAGITALWVSPIYKSPQQDMGYDISDYRDIDELFGSLDDFDSLLKAAHEKNIKVIMDFVPNHTSDQHEWFQNSLQSVEGYEDYYIWRDAAEDGGVPNNWISTFEGPAWEWSEERQQYYFHQFSTYQPDLNYRNENVIKAMKDVLTFWLDRGVDGFRIDAVNFLFEDAEFRDEPESGIEGISPNSSAYLNHVYTRDLPETIDMVYQFRTLLDDYVEEKGGDAKIIMTEAYTDIETTMLYYGNSDGTKLGAHFTFNFLFFTNINLDSTAKDVVNTVNSWFDHMPKVYTANWVTGNHDNHRVASRLGPENVDGYNMLAMLLPGVGLTYNGDEFGQEDGEVEFDECSDPPACLSEELFYTIGRDFERTPLQWDTTVNAGFSEANFTWLPVSEKYLEANLADESEEGVWSHYTVYKSLLELRKEPPFLTDERNIVALSDNVFAFTATKDLETYVFAFNINNETETINLKSAFPEAKDKVEIVIMSANSEFQQGVSYMSDNLEMKDHESFVGIFSGSSMAKQVWIMMLITVLITILALH